MKQSEPTRRVHDLQLLRPETVAEILDVSRSTVVRMITAKVLPAICLRRGRRKAVYRVRREVLEKWILSREKAGNVETRQALPNGLDHGGAQSTPAELAALAYQSNAH